MSDPVGPDPVGPDALDGGGASEAPTRGALVRSSAVVAVGTLLSRVTGLLRVVALLYALDLTRFSDAYNAANTMPNLVYELLLGGILSATLVPVFVDARDRGDDDATSAVVSTAGIALVIVTVVGVMVAPSLVSVITSQVDDPAEAAAQQEVAAFLLRLFMPQVLFYGLITVVTALLHSRRSYAAPAFTPILNNLIVSAMLFSLPALVAWDIDGPDAIFRADDETGLLLVLGLGTTAGVAVMGLALLPSLARQRVRLRFRPDWRHPAVRTVVRLSGWTVGYVVSNQIALYVVLALANGSGEGELSAYQAAFIFFQLPHGLVAVSVMTTFLPELTEAARTGD
ncbi:MAG TPA: lipid II flippase MurJ, partial [Acidimicrobiales bacterium]|nr:lipid II flippase MurJ [Acidimicrobiales bacterium]